MPSVRAEWADLSINNIRIAGKKLHIDNLLTTILFVVVGTSISLLALIPIVLAQLLMLTVVAVMTISYYRNWRGTGKAILGVLIGLGSLSTGFVLYVVLSRGTTDDAIARGEAPPQRFDFFMFGPVIGVLFSMGALLYFYRFKTKDTTDIEKYFSYSLLCAMTIAMVFSYCFNFQV